MKLMIDLGPAYVLPYPAQCMHNAFMVALQIRDVPDEIRDILAAQARAKGQSLQAYLLDLIQTQARRSANSEVLRRFSGRSDGTRMAFGEAAADIADEREERGLL